MAMALLGLSSMDVNVPDTRWRVAHAASNNDNSAQLDIPREARLEAARATQSTPHHHSSRSRHRVTSHHNAFQTSCSVFNDPPPTYVCAARARPSSSLSQTQGQERLPGYSCTVEAEAKLLLNLESVNPLSPVGECDWRELYTVLRGTSLSFYRLKDGGAGKLLRSYTLQHAEVGLASDAEHTILVPQTRLAHLIPSGARRRAWQKDPSLFKPVRQTILRLRAETDQFLLADSSEERIHSLIYAISAAIDIAQPIDDRSIPTQCTVPRRRRRQHRPQFSGDLADPILLAEQERIFRQMFPRFAEAVLSSPRPELDRTVSSDASSVSPTIPTREEEEIDFSMIREDTATRPQTGDEAVRPNAIRSTTTSTVVSTHNDEMFHATSSTNFSSDGKWQPPHNRSPSQMQRYIKRCMPVLNADAPRASDVIICHGRRMRINRRMELLEEWELQPPSYKAHKFDRDSTSLARANSQRSSTGSADHPTTSLMAVDDDQITQAETALESLQLSKMASCVTTPKTEPSEATLHAMADLDPKGRSPEQLAREIEGVVFCF